MCWKREWNWQGVMGGLFKKTPDCRFPLQMGFYAFKMPQASWFFFSSVWSSVCSMMSVGYLLHRRHGARCQGTAVNKTCKVPALMGRMCQWDRRDLPGAPLSMALWTPAKLGWRTWMALGLPQGMTPGTLQDHGQRQAGCGSLPCHFLVWGRLDCTFLS